MLNNLVGRHHPDLDRVTRTYVPREPNGIFLLGEYAEIQDWKVRRYHFSGGSGQELRKMLREVDIDFYKCHNDMVFSIDGLKRFDPPMFIADWTKKVPYIKPEYQPHVDHVLQAIYDSGAHLVVALGDLALFILTGEKSVAKWRGSRLSANINGREIKVIPTYAPSRILKVWDWRHVAMYDLQRAATESLSPTYQWPEYNFIVEPDFPTTVVTLERLLASLEEGPLLISHDLETIARHISCSGIAWSERDAISIPFMTNEEGRGGNHNYWTVDEEAHILWLQQKVLTHSNARVVGQNYLYDMQHIAKSWGYQPNVYMDTMLAWHTVFPGEKKSLDFLASIFCDHYVYWKDELKDYNSYPVDMHQYWNYSCKDGVYTYEIADKLAQLVEAAEQEAQYDFQMSMVDPAFHAMLRGVRIDKTLRRELTAELYDVSAALESWLLEATGNYKPEGSTAKTHWFNSPAQCQSFFYDYLGLPKQRNRKTGRVATDDEALTKLAEIEPVVEPIVRHMQELRSVNIFRKNFLEAPLGPDGRIRCSYNLAGTETFRLASGKDAFGEGANLQTIPSGSK